MTPTEAAALWIGVNLIFVVYLAMRVGQARMRYKINLGDGENPEMTKAIRTHANYTEYAPAALLGLFVLASLGAGTAIIHALGGVFLFARIAHLLGLGMGVWPQGRGLGAAGSALVLLTTAGFLLYYAAI